MSLTDDLEEKLRFMLAELTSDEARKILNSWERDFTADMAKRYDEYGSETRVSPKQWAILNKLYEKVTA